MAEASFDSVSYLHVSFHCDNTQIHGLFFIYLLSFTHTQLLCVSNSEMAQNLWLCFCLCFHSKIIYRHCSLSLSLSFSVAFGSYNLIFLRLRCVVFTQLYLRIISLKEQFLAITGNLTLKNAPSYSSDFRQFVNACFTVDPMERPSASKLLEVRFY